MKIIISHDCPPVPSRRYDWSAHLDDYDGAPDSPTRHQIGYGPTTGEAVRDLLDLLELDEPSTRPDDCLHDLMAIPQWPYREYAYHRLILESWYACYRRDRASSWDYLAIRTRDGRAMLADYAAALDGHEGL